MCNFDVSQLPFENEESCNYDKDERKSDED